MLSPTRPPTSKTTLKVQRRDLGLTPTSTTFTVSIPTLLLRNLSQRSMVCERLANASTSVLANVVWLPSERLVPVSFAYSKCLFRWQRLTLTVVAKIDALQIEYSPWFTDHEDSGLIDAAKELGVSIIAYSPLGKGILSGQ